MINLDRFGGVTEPEDGVYFMTNEQMAEAKEADRLAVILGSEGPGLLPQTIAESDYTIKIPMAEGVDSLNVAAASALAFWEVKKGLD